MTKNKIMIISIVVIFVMASIIFGWIWSSMGSTTTTPNNNINENTNNNTNENGEILGLNCKNEEINNKLQIICTIEGTVTEYEVSAISATIGENNNYKLISVTPDSSWEGDGENGDIDLYTDVNKTDEFKIAEFKLELLNDNIDTIDIEVKDVSFFDEEFLEHKLKNITKNVVIEK